MGSPGIKFVAVVGTERDVKNGIAVTATVRHQCITAMEEYCDKSLEELRFEQYEKNKKGSSHFNSAKELLPTFGTESNNTSGLFGYRPFGSTASNSPFGKTSTFNSSYNKPLFGNTSVFGSTMSKSSFQNPSNFGSSSNNPPFGTKSIFGSSSRNNPFSGSSFCSSKSNPFSEKMSIDPSQDKPLFKNITDVAAFPKISTETQSATTHKTSSDISNSQKTPILETNASSSWMTSFKNISDFRFCFGSKNISNDKLDHIFKFESVNMNAPTNFKKSIRKAIRRSPVNISYDDEEDGQLKTPGPQKKFILQTSAFDVYEEIKTFVSNLQGLVECPVCFGYLGSSLRQCENGHGICGACFSNVDKCPTCQHAYLPHKPTLLWQILECLPKPCLFTDKGCDQIFFNNKEDHETFCKFRPTTCKFETCEWKGTVEGLLSHVKSCNKRTDKELCEIHFQNFKMTRFYEFDQTQDVNFYSAIVFENQVFWKYFRRDSSSKIISHKFYHVMSHKPKQKYYLVISFSKGDIEFTTCVAATKETQNDSDNKTCNEISFFVPDEDLKRFYDAEIKGYVYSQKIIVEDICDEDK